jgi:histidinol-phosphate aminotransferase
MRQRVRDALVAERRRLHTALQGVPFLEPYPSEANFILCRVRGGRDARALKDALAMQHGIMVRHYAKAELSGYIRISVGRPEHTDAVVAALQQLAGEAGGAAAAGGEGAGASSREGALIGKE